MLSIKKRKHKTLSLYVKAEILEKIDKGEKLSVLAKQYGVGQTTIHDIRKNRDRIVNYVNNPNTDPVKRKTLKFGEYPKVEDALYDWFLQQRSTQSPVTGEMLRVKAKYFHRKITNNDNFKASDGWLDRFKKRFGIRLLKISDEECTSKVSTASIYLQKYKENVEEICIVPDVVVDTNESGSEEAQKSSVNQDALCQMQREVEDKDLSCDPIKHEDALTSFNLCIRWAEENKVTAAEIQALRKIRDQVLKQTLISKYQTSMGDYFLNDNN